LLKHPKFANISIDMHLLNEIILCKTYLKLDPVNNTITLNIKVPRDMLIIRDLPNTLENVKEELEIFLRSQSANEFTILSVSAEINDNW